MSNEAILEQLDNQRRRVDVDHFDMTIRELVRMSWSNELERAPAYQRQFRWDSERESLLVESLFLGLPLPSIFVAANADGRWELVDGLQRVSSLMHYTAGPDQDLSILGRKEVLVLSGLRRLSSMNGLTFAHLPMPVRLQFEKRLLRVTVLSDKSDPDVRFDMFERLNSGGLRLTYQEIRACVYRGPLAEFTERMGTDENFNALLKLRSGNEQDGTREELVLKFFAYLENRDQFKDDVKEFLNAYMRDHRQTFETKAGEKRFKRVVKELAKVVGGPVRRKNSVVTPVNLLEALMVGAAEVLDEHGRLATPKGDWLDDKKLTSFSGAGTNSKKSLFGRINRAKELLTPRVL